MNPIVDNSLAKALQKYYTRKGNKILFLNGMTLNQLAWEMWERLGYEGVDPSVLSKVLKGKRLFTFKQLNVFLAILRIKDREREGFQDILRNEVLSRLGIESGDQIPISDYLDYIQSSLPYIRRLEDDGNSVVAEQFAENIFDYLERVFLKVRNSSNKKKSLELIARLQFEMGYVKTLLLTKECVGVESAANWERVKNIGLQLRDKNIQNLAKLGIGFTSYVKEDYIKSEKILRECINNTTDIEEKAWVYKILALDYAYLGKEKEFIKLELEIPKVIENSHLARTRLCELLEGLYRGSSLLDLPKSEKYFDHGVSLIRKLNEAKEGGLFKKVQLMRGQLEVFDFRYKKKRHVDKREVELVGTQGIELAYSLGLQRHEQKMRNFLDNILN